MRKAQAIAALFTALLVWPVVAGARVTETAVRGSFNASQENACIHVSIFFYLTDCSYARSYAEVGGQQLPWTGPTVNPVYYARGSAHAVPAYTPVPGDDRISPALDGTLRIDDRGTVTADDDLISGTLVVGPAARSVVANVNELAGGPAGRPPRAVISWSSISHTLAATAVHAATRNARGGTDYVIGSKGFPARICRAQDAADCFPSALAPKTTDGQRGEGVWAAPGKIGITRDTAMDGNVGARTSAVMADYECTDNRGGITCPSHNVVWRNTEEPLPGARNLSEAPGLDNLLLRVSTDTEGHVVTAEGFWTNEYRIDAGPTTFQVPEGHDNSWQGGYLQVTGVK
jgi:hypothetical protein